MQQQHLPNLVYVQEQQQIDIFTISTWSPGLSHQSLLLYLPASELPFEKNLDNFVVASRRSCLEGIPAASALSIDISASLEENMDKFRGGLHTSGLEGIPVLSTLGIHISTSIEVSESSLEEVINR